MARRPLRGRRKAVIDSLDVFGGKILIVDDQQANVRLLEMMLQRAGYLFISSTVDPARVCALHSQNRYDLIVLDLQMRGMDGFQVMEALKAIQTDDYLPVLVITAQPDQKLRALKAGAKDFISKPFDNSEVLTRIRNMLEVRLLHEQCRTHGKLLEDMVRERTAELRASEEMFRDLAANIPEALWIRDVERGTIRYVNPAWEKLSGFTCVPGDPLEKVLQAIHPNDRQWLAHERRKSPSTHAGIEYRLVRPDESVRWVHARTFTMANSSGNTPWVVEIIEDVTLRREAQRQLVHLARHDALTDLPNRTLLYEALRDALARAEKDRFVVSVLLLDIDDFKTVNDTLGHTIGDALLREFAARLMKCVRPGDTVGRLGGDEFAVIVLTPNDARGAIEVAHRIQNACIHPMTTDDQNMLVTTSIGIASFPTDTTDLETLIRFADAAMYDAKASGRNAFRCYTAEMNARAMEKLDIEGALRFAQRREEFVLHYQPKVQIDSGKWTSVEALLRWNRPGHGLVLPGNFIPALEEMGLIVPVGAWVIDMACRQIRQWELSELGQVGIAVNVSSRQVREEQFVSQVAEMVREHHIDPRLLEFEITESALFANGESADIALRKLKDLGISISIDDFGTGYSNLAYLKRFLVDSLKIDISFIRDVTTNADDATIAVAIINMAHSLRLKVVAEGVETREQLDFLRVHGCDQVQGYFLSRPLPADEFSARFRETAAYRAKQRPVSLATRRSAAHA
jgi:diguanylate cyclase (GGDEF)-like protein/PAS domain S-box-containing protein